MRKTALFLALLLVVGQGYGLCYPATVDSVIEDQSKSELHPIADTAKVAGAVNDGINKVIDTEPISTVITPVEKVRKETLKGGYKITNALWDFLTLRWIHGKK